MSNNSTNITSTVIKLAIEHLIANSTTKPNIIDPTQTIKEITRHNLNFKTLIAIFLLLIYIISAPIFLKLKFYFLHLFFHQLYLVQDIILK